MEKYYCMTALTPLQVQSLSDLIDDCHKFEPLQLSFPEDGDLFLFICDKEKTLSCLIVCKVQEDLWECYAFTRPSCRKKGLFSTLLKKLCQITPAYTELVFLLDHQSPDALCAVEAMEMELWRTEYQMERRTNTLPEYLSGNSSSIATEQMPSFFLYQKDFIEEGIEGWLFSAFLSANPVGNPAKHLLGRCRVLTYSPSRFYLYHVEISKKLRHQGWGTKLINAVIHTLPENSSLFLQVSADNKPALKLYKKTGFHITETLSYYFYHLPTT